MMNWINMQLQGSQPKLPPIWAIDDDVIRTQRVDFCNVLRLHVIIL
jgi:hypothetical protein